MPSKPDVTTEQDVRQIVDAFYGDIDQDPLLGAYFAGLDMDAHLPRMYAFWSSIVFQTGTYRGRPFDAHLALSGLSADHFTRWLDRFCRTVDARFEGEHAERMKARARQIAGVFQHKMNLSGTS